MNNVLDRIVTQKWRDIEQARSQRSLAELQTAIASAPAVRDFPAALRAARHVALIAEVKKASPSAGIIREDFDPVTIATAYADHGASCISVLTDESFFQGRLEFLKQVRAAVPVPVLRKDFLLDPYQVWEARAAGADCVLLIAECLEQPRLLELYELAGELGMSALVEIYEPENLQRVLSLQPPMIGINNRNLKTFVTDLEHSIRLRAQIPEEVLLVSESGIRTAADVSRLRAANVQAMLVGESLMRQDDIGAAVDALLAIESSN